MSIEYGCATTNKFCFLDENEVEDPSELLAQVSITATKKDAKDAKSTSKDAKGAKTAGKPGDKAKTGAATGRKTPLQQTDNSVKPGSKPTDLARKPAGQKTGPREDKENTSNRPAGSAPTGERRPPRTDGERRPPRPDGERRPPRPDGERRPPRPDGERRPPRRPEGEVAQGGEGDVEGEGFRRNNGGNFRGPRGGQSGFGGGQRGGAYRGQGGQFRPRRNDPDHPREMDRHSGSEKTGVKAVDKKDGAGKSNWGTYNDDIAAEGETLNETAGEQSGADQEGENSNWAARVDESEEGKNDENKEVVPNFMTLDEYKALKNEVNKKNEFNIRKPGEGEDQKRWDGFVVLQKKEDEEDEEEEEEEEEEDEENEEDRKKNQLLNQIQIVFNEPASAGRGDRRDRGERGERGDRGDRGDRGERGGERRGPPRERVERRKSERSDKGAVSGNEGAGEQAAPADEAKRGPRPNRGPGGPGGPRTGGPAGERPERRDERRDGGQQQRRGPGGPRPNQPRVNVPRIEDEKDFPSLGK